MISRNYPKRKYRPAFEAIEHKQLLSAGIATVLAVSPPRAAAVVSPRPPQLDIQPCGTGKGIIIITS